MVTTSGFCSPSMVGPKDDRYRLMCPSLGLPRSSMPPTLITAGTLAGGST